MIREQWLWPASSSSAQRFSLAMRRQGERPELIRWRLCGTSKTWSFVPQRRMKMFRARVRLSKTLSVRMDRDNYDFLHDITKEEGRDLSKADRDMVTRASI